MEGFLFMDKTFLCENGGKKKKHRDEPKHLKELSVLYVVCA